MAGVAAAQVGAHRRPRALPEARQVAGDLDRPMGGRQEMQGQRDAPAGERRLKVADAGYLAAAAPKLYNFFAKMGLLLRPLGNTIYVMPPYCTAADELERVYAAIAKAADLLNE